MKFNKFDRASGILLNVSSLSGEYGIGCFSSDAIQFADMAADMGFHWWQVLPLTMLGAGNSPYCASSTYAGNRLYICPAGLRDDGLLTNEEVDASKYRGEPYRTDYEFAKANADAYLHLAFSRLDGETKKDVESFREDEKDWIEDYALFMVIADENSTAWWKWEDGLKFRDEKALDRVRKEKKDEIDFYIFEQYEFYKQWHSLKEKVNARGVKIIGDLPFYVATDSVDVWANPKDFQLDEDLLPKKIAGVPPDAFSKAGQIWGNCVYDFDAMKKNGYKWWRRRIRHTLRLYDALRLDHFRAFYNYFAIPASDYDTAANGKWEDGPKCDLLDRIKSDNPDALFIAEDLGLIDSECREFIDSLGIPTMRVFEFGFDGTPSAHLPYRYECNTVAYTGTHDNNTLLGWLYELNEGARDYVLKYCGFSGAGWGAGGPECRSTKAIIKTLAMSSSSLLVLPYQDMLGYGGDTRMNVPGVAEGNWTYRLPYHLMSTVDRDFFLGLNSTYGRMGSGIAKR